MEKKPVNWILTEVVYNGRKVSVCLMEMVRTNTNRERMLTIVRINGRKHRQRTDSGW